MGEPSGAVVFLDSGAFVAFLVGSHGSHAAVRMLFERPPPRQYTSPLVIAETYETLLHGFGEEAAGAFRELLAALPSLEILGADYRHTSAALRKLEGLTETGTGFVDASSLVFLREVGIAEVWSTDERLAIEGARVVPGQPTPGE